MAVQASVSNQASYRATEYLDSEWEVVGEVANNDQFSPLGFQVLGSRTPAVDPMFSDFSGAASEKVTKRWHIPSHMKGQGLSAEAEELVIEKAKMKGVSEEELKVKVEQAYQAGVKDATEKIAIEQTQKLTAMEQKFNATLQDMIKQLNLHASKTEVQAVALSIEIAKKIIDGAVEINPEYIVKIVRDALSLAAGATLRKVKVSPQDMEFIEVVGVSKQLREFDGAWKFEADPTIRAGCIVETSAGTIDYRIDNAWERVKDNVLKLAK